MDIQMRRWVDIAKKHGAIFDNIELVSSDGSYSVRAIDIEKKSLLKIPYPILLPESAMKITDSGHMVKEEFDIPDDVRELLNGYLALILSDERVDREERILDEFISLPEEFKSELTYFNCHLLLQKISRRDLKIRLIQARTISMKGVRTLMPFIDFMNHDSENGIGYNVEDDYISIEGKSPNDGELYATYNILNDAFSFMQTYLFVPQTENVTSMDMAFNIDSDTKLAITRNYIKMKVDQHTLTTKEYCVSEDTISLPIMWLGSHKKPRNPFWSFRRIWEGELGRDDTQRVYSIIKSLNVKKLMTIIRLCDNFTKESEAISMIRESAMQHLTLIGESYEDLVSYPN